MYCFTCIYVSKPEGTGRVYKVPVGGDGKIQISEYQLHHLIKILPLTMDNHKLSKVEPLTMDQHDPI